MATHLLLLLLFFSVSIADACLDVAYFQSNWDNDGEKITLQYGNENPTDHQKLDLYKTAAAKDQSIPVPTLVYVHGGGWRGKSKDAIEETPFVLDFRKYGFHVASIEYRFSNHAIWPAQIDDVENAVNYLRQNAQTYNLDPDLIIAIGPSAGGHLVSMLGVRNSASWLRGVVDFFGTASLIGPLAVGSPGADLLGCTEAHIVGTDCHVQAVTASPIEHVDATNPPFLIWHGYNDTTVPHEVSVLFDQALTDAGADSTLYLVMDAGHSMNNCIINKFTDGQPHLQILIKWVLRRALVCSCNYMSCLNSLISTKRTTTASASGRQ